MIKSNLLKVHWFAQQPTPYNDFLFEAIDADPDIELTVHFMQATISTHPWKSGLERRFDAQIYPNKLQMLYTFARLSLTCNRRDLFIIGGRWFVPATMLVAGILGLRNCLFAMWTDTPQWNKKRSIVNRALRRFWMRYLFKRAHIVFGTGDPCLDILAAEGCPRDKLWNYPYVIDCKRFFPGDRLQSPNQDPIIFISSGILHNAHKGYHLALEALAEVRNTQGASFLYRIAGTGPDEENLRALAERLGIHDQVEFLGWLDPEQLPDFYRSGDVFLHPAYFEPYGVAVLEAMATGLVVIGSDQTMAIIDRIESGINGVIHRTGDAHDLANKITHILTDSKTRRALGRAARRTAEKWQADRSIRIIKEAVNLSGN